MFSPLSHPSRQQLHDYAESHVHRETPVQATVAGHVNRCARCKTEVAEIRESLSFTHSAGHLEPTQDLTAQILMAAQQERRGQRPAWWMRVRWLRAVGAAMVIVAILAVGAFAFAYALGTGYLQQAQPISPQTMPGPADAVVPFAPEGLDAAVAKGAAASTPAREVLEAALARAHTARLAAEAAQRISPRNAEAALALHTAETQEPAILRQLYLGQLPAQTGE
jgi:hypothetical protein